MDLLENDGKPMKLRINKGFAKKFEQRKKREHLEKSKQTMDPKKMKEIFNDEENSEQSSSSESEDEVGELVNDDVVHDFVKSLAKIREKKPEIYNPSTHFFEEEYDSKNQDKKPKTSALYYKDMVREEALHGYKDEDSKKKKILKEETPVEEQIRLKKEFQMAASLEKGEDNFFSMKQKTEREVEDENVLFQRFLAEEARKNKPDEVEMLKRFWGDDTKLDDTDKFLRRYIMTKGWVDEDMIDIKEDNDVDKEDEERDEEIENYEEKFNFRFEEPGAEKILTYSREIPESMRKKNEGRTEKRKEKNERKKEEKKKMEEEIKQLKKIKKEEIFDRIEKIQKIGGTNKFSENFQNFIEKEFDPNTYDKEMKENFNEEYYGNEDQNEEDLKEYLKEIKKNEDEFLKQNDNKALLAESGNNESKKENEDKENVLIPKTSIPIILKHNLNKNEVKEIKETGNTNLWWYCDECLKGIKELETRYDCFLCEDYTVCKKCFELKVHKHKMRKNIVPEGCIPPSDEEIKEIATQFKNCNVCKLKLTESSDYYFEKKNESNVLCDTCFLNLDMKAKRAYQFKEGVNDLLYVAEKAPHKLKNLVDDEELKKLVDEYYGLDFEDIIAGGIKTRFKYTNVEAEDFGLDDELLLYTDDKLLNNYVGLKNIAPYKSQQVAPTPKSLKKKKRLLEINAQENKKMLTKQIKKVEKIEKKIKDMHPKTKKELKKQKILERKAEKMKASSVAVMKKNEIVENKIEIETLEEENKPSTQNNSRITNDRLQSYGMMYQKPNKPQK